MRLGFCQAYLEEVSSFSSTFLVANYISLHIHILIQDEGFRDIVRAIPILPEILHMHLPSKSPGIIPILQHKHPPPVIRHLPNTLPTFVSFNVQISYPVLINTAFCSNLSPLPGALIQSNAHSKPSSLYRFCSRYVIPDNPVTLGIPSTRTTTDFPVKSRKYTSLYRRILFALRPL